MRLTNFLLEKWLYYGRGRASDGDVATLVTDDGVDVDVLRDGKDVDRGSDSSRVNQLLLTVAASLGYLTIGLVRGYSSSAVISMQELSPDLVPSVDAASWISAAPPLGASLGSICAGPLLTHLGRKHTLAASAPLFACGWVLIALSSSYQMMLAARLLTGFCAGLVMPSAQIYVSECSDTGVRGILGSLPALFMAGGILVSYMLGAWLPWNSLAWTSAVFPAMLLFALMPLPQSPVWLKSRGRTADADIAMTWLHHAKPASPLTPVKPVPAEGRYSVFTVMPGEQEQMPPPLKDDKAVDSVSDAEIAEEVSCISSLFRRPVIIPLLLSLALLAFQQLSGIDAIIFYTVSIFRASGSPINDHLATILVGLVQLVSNVMSLFLVDRAGRRPLLIASGLLMAVAMTALGTYFQLLEDGRAGSIQMLPLVSLLVFMVGFSIGYGTLPFLLMGELLPVKQRSMFGSIAASFNLGVMFVVIKTYPNLKLAIGLQGTFWLYAGMCLLSCIFVWFLVPETKGKSLDEIEQYFENRHQKLLKTKEDSRNKIVLPKEDDRLVNTDSRRNYVEGSNSLTQQTN